MAAILDMVGYDLGYTIRIFMTKIPPRIFSAPYRSPLWQHLVKIKEMLKKDATWTEIADVLNKSGVTLTPQSICKFYNRYASRKRPLPYKLRNRLEPERLKSRFTIPDKDTTPRAFISTTD